VHRHLEVLNKEYVRIHLYLQEMPIELHQVVLQHLRVQ
jgi:hypothetical protein